MWGQHELARICSPSIEFNHVLSERLRAAIHCLFRRLDRVRSCGYPSEAFFDLECTPIGLGPLCSSSSAGGDRSGSSGSDLATAGRRALAQKHGVLSDQLFSQWLKSHKQFLSRVSSPDLPRDSTLANRHGIFKRKCAMVKQTSSPAWTRMVYSGALIDG